MDGNNWEYERECMIRYSAPDSELVRDCIDEAADHARNGDLHSSAVSLERMRQTIVSNDLFRKWDDGILTFCAIIRMVRKMSGQETVPASYQRFIDATPDLLGELTSAQKKFWYGVPGEKKAQSLREELFSIRPANDKFRRADLIWLGILAAAIAIYWFSCTP